MYVLSKELILIGELHATMDALNQTIVNLNVGKLMTPEYQMLMKNLDIGMRAQLVDKLKEIRKELGTDKYVAELQEYWNKCKRKYNNDYTTSVLNYLNKRIKEEIK